MTHLRKIRPHVVATFDPYGGYGHKVLPSMLLRKLGYRSRKNRLYFTRMLGLPEINLPGSFEAYCQFGSACF